MIALLKRATQLVYPICIMITRLRLDAALCRHTPSRQLGQRGCSHITGIRLPTLNQVLHKAKNQWWPLTMASWYGEGRSKIQIVSGTAVWRHTDQPAVPDTEVLIRNLYGEFKRQALLRTDLKVDCEPIWK